MMGSSSQYHSRYVYWLYSTTFILIIMLCTLIYTVYDLNTFVSVTLIFGFHTLYYIHIAMIYETQYFPYVHNINYNNKL